MQPLSTYPLLLDHFFEKPKQPQPSGVSLAEGPIGAGMSGCSCSPGWGAESRAERPRTAGPWQRKGSGTYGTARWAWHTLQELGAHQGQRDLCALGLGRFKSLEDPLFRVSHQRAPARAVPGLLRHEQMALWTSEPLPWQTRDGSGVKPALTLGWDVWDHCRCSGVTADAAVKRESAPAVEVSGVRNAAEREWSD